MFESIIRDARRAVNSTIERIVERAIIAVPFVVSVGFATAALVSYLTEVYGARLAYTIVAGVFAIVGVIVALSMPSSHDDAESLAQNSNATSTEAKSGSQASSSMGDVGENLASVVTLLAGNPRLALSGVALLLRNVPLLLMAGILGYLLLCDTQKAERETQPAPGPAE
jgi:hypothetical protein